MRLGPSKPRSHEAERPFWISFADLMSALMVLFLVALTVALFSVTQKITETEQLADQRQAVIEDFMQRVAVVARRFPGVTVRGTVVDFGERARFDSNSHRLGLSQMQLLREFVPEVLELARDQESERWLRQIVVTGYADPRGSYLYNLNLSLQRSQRVLCALLVPHKELPALSDRDQKSVRELFRVSGASFNTLRADDTESRRIELRLEFSEMSQSASSREAPLGEPDLRCPLDHG